MKIIDPHIHWWDLEKNYYPWLMDQKPEEGGLSGNESIAKTYLCEHYLEDAKDYELLGVVHIQADWDPKDPLGESRWLQKLIDEQKEHGLLKAFMGFADLSQKNVEPLLEAQSDFSHCVGIRQILNYLPHDPNFCWASEDYLKNDIWLDNFHLLEKYDLAFDLMCFSNHMVQMAQLAHQYPNIKIHLEHTGMPHDSSADGQEQWVKGMKALAQHSNVDVKISGLGNVIDNWTIELIRPWVLDAIKIFGTRRVMFASNFPTDSKFSSFNKIYDAFDQITADFSKDEREKMFYKNAVQCYDFIGL